MNHYVKTIAPTVPGNSTVTPQTKAIPGREAEMVKNSAGGFTFQLDEWGYLDRFLILGSDKSTYYASATKLTKDAAKNVMACIKLDGVKTVNRIVEISDSGRAPKNDSAVFALALSAIYGDQATVQAAYAALPKVCRIGTHLFQFVSALDAMGKWNAAAKRGVAAWYTARRDDRLAVQFLKYGQRDGWSHKDVLRLAHVRPTTDIQAAMFNKATESKKHVADLAKLPALYDAVEQLKTANAKTAVKLIEANKDISWEMIPSELQRDANVWHALLPNMGITALIRKLGQLTNVGVIKPLSEGSKLVINRLTDAEAIKAGRVHPVTILNALKTYQQGRGDKGSLVWSPDSRVVDALDDSFYEAFNFVDSTGESYLIGIDCSGSMWWASSKVNGLSSLVAAEVAAVMALGLAKREKNYFIAGFGTSMTELKISPKMKIADVLRVMQTAHLGGTDCALPMIHAKKNKMDVDKFCVYTDNETWAGRNGHPSEALRDYRKAMNKKAKLIVCATSVTDFTIADPKDPGMLDIVGFDSAAPQLIQTF